MLDTSTLSMPEILRLQAQLQQELTQRFQKLAGLLFTDIVGSTAYFHRFGDVAGRQLQQLHLDLLQGALAKAGGRLVDTAGDGGFCVFDSALAAVQAATALQQGLAQANAGRGREHQLALRIGVHWGPVLTDGQVVSGDTVNTCARVAASAEPGELRLTRPAALALPAAQQAQCQPLGEVVLKGIAQPMALLALDWRDRQRFPRLLFVQPGGMLLRLPNQDLVTVGRQAESGSGAASDLLLSHPNPGLTKLISRAHFELRRSADGLMLHALSSQATLVDDLPVAAGSAVPVAAGSRIQVAGVLTLQLQAEAPAATLLHGHDDDATVLAASMSRVGGGAALPG